MSSEDRFPTLITDHPHKLRDRVRHMQSGRLFQVMAIIVWGQDIDSCDQVIAAPVDDLEAWTTFYEFELEAA